MDGSKRTRAASVDGREGFKDEGGGGKAKMDGGRWTVVGVVGDRCSR